MLKRFTKDILDAKIKKDNLVNESGLNEKIKKLATKEEIKILATKAELKAGKDNFVKIQTLDLSYFCDKSHFEDDGIQKLFSVSTNL